MSFHFNGNCRSYFFPRLTPIGVAIPLMVAYSRVAMGRHYFTDVIGGEQQHKCNDFRNFTKLYFPFLAIT